MGRAEVVLLPAPVGVAVTHLLVMPMPRGISVPFCDSTTYRCSPPPCSRRRPP
jgi:hypothetical protein